MKHRIKMGLRELWARLLFHTGLFALVDRLMPRRLVILAGHCVAEPGGDDFLPNEMKISAAKLERILGWLGKRFELCTVGEGIERIAQAKGRSLVALSMDDGYRDNVEVMLPMLARLGVPATVFLESRPLAERRVNYTHKYFWLLARRSAEDLVVDYVAISRDEATNIRLQQVVAEGVQVTYRLKRVLKYEAEPRERDRTIDALFDAAGGDERALCDELYLDREGARKLRAGGIEIGGHTVSHHVLATLPAAEQEREVAEGRRVLEQELGTELRTFAYPFGRDWDYDANSLAAVRTAGFRAAVTTHPGTNSSSTDPLRLKRWMIDDQAELHLIATEACGGFDLLRRLGLDLSEG